MCPACFLEQDLFCIGSEFVKWLVLVQIISTYGGLYTYVKVLLGWFFGGGFQFKGVSIQKWFALVQI